MIVVTHTATTLSFPRARGWTAERIAVRIGGGVSSPRAGVDRSSSIPAGRGRRLFPVREGWTELCRRLGTKAVVSSLCAGVDRGHSIRNTIAAYLFPCAQGWTSHIHRDRLKHEVSSPCAGVDLPRKAPPFTSPRARGCTGDDLQSHRAGPVCSPRAGVEPNSRMSAGSYRRLLPVRGGGPQMPINEGPVYSPCMGWTVQPMPLSLLTFVSSRSAGVDRTRNRPKAFRSGLFPAHAGVDRPESGVSAHRGSSRLQEHAIK